LIIYLDQNKWIELARIIHGKEKSEQSVSVLNEVLLSLEHGYIYPLSAFHYLEFARISNPQRRSRLGEVMWRLSQGSTICSIDQIVQREIEVSLTTFFPSISPRNLNLIGKGITHAFGKAPWNNNSERLNTIVDEAMLTGRSDIGIEPISFMCQKQREIFLSHLKEIHEKKHQLPKSKWDNWLYAMALTDIMKPLHEVFTLHNLDINMLELFITKDLNKIVDSMPTRVVDVHLHRQVLRNSNYKAQLSDLEDWGGLGVAVCYCDVVVCERHFADMLRRDNFKTKARIETNLHNIFENIN